MTLNRVCLRSLVGCAAAVAATSVGAQGSTPADGATLRERCHLASRTLQSGHRGPHTRWALGFITLCPGEAAPALGAQWAGKSVPSAAELNELVLSSQHIRDQRLFDAVAATARSVTHPFALRVAALEVLASYVDKRVVVSAHDLEHPDTAAHLPLGTDAFPVDGAVPLDADARAGALALFAALAAEDPDARVRAAAQYLTRGFRTARP